MRRFIPCSLSIIITIFLWNKANLKLSSLLSNCFIGLSWMIVYPLCYWLTYHKNTINIDNHFDIAFAAYLFSFLGCFRILLLYINNYKYEKFYTIFFAFIQTICLIIPILQLWYFFTYNSVITPAAALAFLQTNPHEMQEYILQNIGYSGIFVIILTLIFLIISLSYLNNMKISGYTHNPYTTNHSILPIIKNKFFITTLIVFISISMYSQSILMRTGVLSSYVYANDYLKSSQKFDLYHSSNFRSLSVSPTSPSFFKPSTIIVVIGESANRDFFSAYHNLDHDTTPWLRQSLEQDNFLLFRHAYASWGQTVPSLERALTEKNQYNDKEFNQSVSIIDIAKKAGYKTYWFSNQGTMSDADTPITLIAKTADTSFWLEDTLANSNNVKYDGDLVPYLQMLNPADNNFVVFHLHGSHENYFNRYPASFNKFGTDNERDPVLTYYNSLSYSDYVMNQIFDYSTKNLNLQSMVYFSDHGSDPYRKRHPDQTGFRSLRIPLFIYVSDEYKTLYPQTFSTMKKHSSLYFTNDLIYEAICGLLQIKSDRYLPENSILDSSYKFTRETLTTNLGKLKLTEDTEEK